MAGLGRLRLLRVLITAVLGAAAAMLCAAAQEAPAYKMLRYDEDWSRLRTRTGTSGSDLFDPLKYVPLSDDWYLTVGGEVRERFEFFNNGGWGREEQYNRYLLQRYMLHADVHFGSRVRFFGQLKSGLEVNRTGGPRPPDEDRLDVHQAFIDVDLWQSGKNRVLLRTGRQEMTFGSSRLVSFREGPNVRQSFDGARLSLHAAKWQVDAFATRPAETGRGVFDDSPDHTRSFWGVYGVRPVSRRLNLDVYYLGIDRKRARFDTGSGREQRHSTGTRLWGKTGSWDYNYEAVLQWGRFGAGEIRAWTTASDTGYRIDSLRLRPRFGLRADIASGDRNPADQRLGTFNALFPKGAYFSEADLLGPYNLMDLHPSVELQLHKRLVLTPEADFFWRQSTRDGVYGIAGNLLQSGLHATARYVGSHAAVKTEFQIDRHTSLTAMFLHFFPGEFLRQAPPAKMVNFVGVWMTFKF